MAKKETKAKEQNPIVTTPAAEVAVSTRGRTFEGVVVKKFHKRVVLEFERTVFVQKYERFYNKKTRIHARLPENIIANIGDRVKVMECRPLSKIIHFIVTEKTNLEAKK
jgi:small subunit ribosomal protein S17